MAKKHRSWVKILVCVVIIAAVGLAVIIRPRYLLRGATPLEPSITHLRVFQGHGLGEYLTSDMNFEELLYVLEKTQLRDITYYINLDDLLHVLAETRIRRDADAWGGLMAADWIIEISQSRNRSMFIALGETHGMITERGFGQLMFHISNGDDIRKALEGMAAEQQQNIVYRRD
jgi:hypothetical protein